MRHLNDARSESNAALEVAALQEAAGQWASHDPDPATAAALRSMIDGAAADPAELADSFSGNLEFGTAGLRAAMGPGPNRMNRVVVRRAAAGVAAHLLALAAADGMYRPRAVVGFDARHNSADFARETAAIFAAAGVETFLMPAPLPTPVLAYAVRALDCEAGIMVTASHNPRQDNGYKVYLGGRAVAPEARGVQIVAPHDSLIAGHIAQVANTKELGDTSGIAMAESGWTVLGPELVAGYIKSVAELADAKAFPDRELKIVHTSMHGVGHETALAVLARAGFNNVHAVPEQTEPDPEFPTVVFPNPEEPGAMDLAFALAREVGAALARSDLMVITGGGGGIMAAAHEGAGLEHSLGFNITLPFEQHANPTIDGTDNLLSFHFFFTRKLFFVKEADALVLCPGGFGTLDEALEVLTLIQTGKSPLVPVVLLDAPGGGFWQGALDFIRSQLEANRYILPTDLKLVRLVYSAEEAVDEINQFYANFHSTRWLKRQFVVRMNHPLSERALAHIQTAFADLRLSDDFQQLAYGGEEHDEAHFSHLTRLVFNFTGRNQGRLRELVDYINLPENWAQAQGKTQQRVAPEPA